MCVCAPGDICSANSSEMSVCGGVTLASALYCHGNCSRCGLLGSKEERRDDLQSFGGKEEAEKKRRREREIIKLREKENSHATVQFSLKVLVFVFDCFEFMLLKF